MGDCSKAMVAQWHKLHRAQWNKQMTKVRWVQRTRKNGQNDTEQEVTQAYQEVGPKRYFSARGRTLKWNPWQYEHPVKLHWHDLREVANQRKSSARRIQNKQETRQSVRQATSCWIPGVTMTKSECICSKNQNRGRAPNKYWWPQVINNRSSHLAKWLAEISSRGKPLYRIVF